MNMERAICVIEIVYFINGINTMTYFKLEVMIILFSKTLTTRDS